MATAILTRAVTLSDRAFARSLPRYRATFLVIAGALFVAVAAQVSFTLPQWYADIIGGMLIDALGLPWLHFSFADMTVGRTLDWGLWAFIPGDIVKLLIAAAALLGAWALLGRRRGASTPENAG